MADHRITIRIPARLAARLRERSRLSGQTPSQVVRVAIENHLEDGKRLQSAYDAALKAGVIGYVDGLPEDLSRDPSHFEGFGRGR